MMQIEQQQTGPQQNQKIYGVAYSSVLSLLCQFIVSVY